MASSNFPNRPFRLEERGWINWQDIATNRSSVHSELWIVKNAAYTSWSNGSSTFQHWANNVQVNSGSFTYNFGNYDELKISTIDFLVNHAADGSSSFEIAGIANVDVLGYTELHVPITLPVIARSTVPTFPSPADAGSPLTITLPRADPAWTHDLIFAFGALDSQPITTGAGASYAWTPPLSLLAQIPNSVQGDLWIGATTKKAGVRVGYQQTLGTLRAGPTIVPTITAVTVTDNNADVQSKVGKLVQGLSAAKVAVTATGVYGSTITAKSATFGGVSAAENVPIAITTAGTVTVVGVATDTRGRTATSSGSIQVLAYDVPKINGTPLLQRCTSAGVPADNGTYLRVDLNAAVSSLVNGTEKNAMTITISTRERGTSMWTTRNVIAPGLTYSTNFIVTGGGIYDITKAWDVRVAVADKFQTATQDLVAGTERVIFDLGPGGTGFGKRWTQGAADFGPGGIWDDGKLALNEGRIGTLTEILAGVAGKIPSAAVMAAFRGSGTTAQRDAAYGVPTTDPTRVLLANRQLTWFNTDLGWEESYYAVTGTSGLTARGLAAGASAGWYPTGDGPRINLTASGTMTFAAGTEFNAWRALGESTLPDGLGSWRNSTIVSLTGGRVTTTLWGRYRILATLYGPGGSGTAIVAVSGYRAAALVSDWQQEITLLSGVSVNRQWEIPDVLVRAGDQFVLRSASSSGAGWGAGATSLTLAYIGPPLVSL